MLKIRDQIVKRNKKRERKLAALARLPKPKPLSVIVREKRKARFRASVRKADTRRTKASVGSSDASDGEVGVDVGEDEVEKDAEVAKVRKGVEIAAPDGKIMIRVNECGSSLVCWGTY
jgi:hypothetical protein